MTHDNHGVRRYGNTVTADVTLQCEWCGECFVEAAVDDDGILHCPECGGSDLEKLEAIGRMDEPGVNMDYVGVKEARNKDEVPLRGEVQ